MGSAIARAVEKGLAVPAVMTYQRRTTVASQQSLGPALRPLREKHGSLREFAKVHGITSSTLSRFERGYDTNLSAVLIILKALGCFVCGPDNEEIS